MVDADAGRRDDIRVRVRHQPGAGAAVPDHQGLWNGGPDAVVQLADYRVSVRDHVLCGLGRVRRVPALRPHQVGIVFNEFGIRGAGARAKAPCKNR